LDRLFLCCLILFSCKKDDNPPVINPPQIPDVYYLGADLSYVNEMLDCGGIYRDNGVEVDPYSLFAAKGADMVRVRMWNSPDWTNYSNFADVQLTIQRAKDTRMKVLLDFHLSDTWADPSRQIIPQAWNQIQDVQVLGDSVYNFISNTLRKLGNKDLMPDIVQVGNETNIEILQQENNMVTSYINWDRNNLLFGSGLAAVKDISEEFAYPIETMIHIAEPENALWWFEEAKKHSFPDFDWIGLSYYPKWSKVTLPNLGQPLKTLMSSYNKKVMIVETGYPHTTQDADNANNILGSDILIANYPATPEGQKKYLIDLTKIVLQSGAQGVIYWEPGWISTSCSTQWAIGSHWDNATFFDATNGNESLPAFDFFDDSNYQN